MNMQERTAAIDWGRVAIDMNERGYSIVPDIMRHDECNDLIASYNNADLYRKTVVMERYRFGKGEYKYFRYPLTGIIAEVRKHVYPYLVPIGNSWMQVLNIATRFPSSLAELHQQCHANKQDKPTPLILKYGPGGYNTLHQDLYGDIFFPMQLVVFLTEPAIDYTGGEFVLTQQTPRAQSKAIVVQPKKGDMLVFTTNFRPVKGAKGYYKVNMKHGVSEVHSGERHTLGVIFHDALS